MSIYRLILVFAFVCLLAACTSTNSDSTGDMVTIGIINPVSIRDQVVDDFKTTMEELGYIEGENVTYRYEGAIPDPDERRAWGETLVNEGVDLIFAVATPGGQTAVTVTDTIPIVFVPVTDPVGAGLVESLENPNGNATGVTNGNPHGLRMQFLIDLMPDIDTVYVPFNPDSSPAIASFPDIEQVAEANDVTLIRVDVRTAEEIAEAFTNIPEEADALFVVPDPSVANYATTAIDELAEKGIPIISLSRNEVEQGILLAYGEELDAAAAQAARMVDVILRGTSPSDLPVETTEYFLSLNLETAERLGIDVSDDFLQRVNFIVRAED